ncbi:SRT-28 protein, partial [Aphelenchoides avenae]
MTRQLKKSSYKIMFYLGINDVMCLWINGFLTAYLGINGDVFCTQPTLIYAAGVSGNGETYISQPP